MSTGGLFILNSQLTKRSGDVLNAMTILYQQINKYTQFRTEHNLDPTPSISDIERTHILFVNNTYRPFVHVAFEYFKTTPTGAFELGDNDVSIDISNYGDFFCDMAVHVRMNNDERDSDGSLIGVNVLEDTREDATLENTPMYKFCPFLGERLFKSVKFEVRGELIDEYDSHDSAILRNFHLPKNKEVNYFRLVAQELPITGYVERYGYPGNDAQGVDGKLANVCYLYREKTSLCGGYQTPKTEHDVVDLWIPLHFWFCESLDQCLPVSIFPHSSKLITLNLASVDEIIGLVPRGVDKVISADELGCVVDDTNYDYSTIDDLTINKPDVTIELYTNSIFIPHDIFEMYIINVGFHLIRVFKKFKDTISGGDNIRLTNISYPIENLYVGCINSNYYTGPQPQLTKNLDRWHCFTEKKQFCYEDKAHLTDRLIFLGTYNQIDENGFVSVDDGFDFTDLKPMDSVFIVATDSIKSNPAPPVNVTDPGKGIVLPVVYVPAVDPVGFQIPAVDPLSAPGVNSSVGPAAFWTSIRPYNSVGKIYRICKTGRKIFFDKTTKCISNLKLSSHGVTLFNETYHPIFWNSYIPYRYPRRTCCEVASPPDVGLFMFTFSFYPYKLQPSGYYNIHKTRVIDMELTTEKQVTQDSGHEIVVLARILNFILVDQDSYQIKYT